MPPSDQIGLRPLRHDSLNPLVKAATPLLALVSRLRDAPSVADPDGLRRRIEAELREFEPRAVADGASPDQVMPARYALCATVDDLVLNTPWGAASSWAQRGMVAIFFGEATGSVRVFAVLAALLRAPAQSVDLLTLFYLCLELGLEGPYRTQPAGTAELKRLREEIYRRLRQRPGETREPLALHWRGAVAAARRRRPLVPIWVWLVVVIAVVSALYQGASYALNQESDQVFARLRALVPADPAAIIRPETALPVPAAEPAAAADRLAQLRQALAADIADGDLEVADTDQGVMVRIVRHNLFESGSSTLDPAADPLLARIAAALDPIAGPITVAGHTDNVPISNLRFPSNWHLSLARAQAVIDALAPAMSQPDRLTAEGRADAEPISSNDTPEGRERNRRIELILGRAP